MATTQANQLLEALKYSNFSKLKENISAVIAEYFESKGYMSLDEFSQGGVIDMTYFRDKVTGYADLKGIEFLAPYIKEFYLPDLIQQPVYSQLVGKINVTNWSKLEVLSDNSEPYQAFTGSLANLSGTLKRIVMTSDSSGTLIKLPVLSAQPNLISVYYNGTGFAVSNTIPLPEGGSVSSYNITVANTGGLSANLLLQKFRLINLGPANITNSRLVIDDILRTLKDTKVAGGVINTIDFSGSPAPTGGASNANAVWLAANNVTVTLGTL